MSEKFYQMTPRIARLKQMLNDEVPALSAERAKLATEAIELYAAEPPVLQKAHMLDYILRRMTIFIQDGELIVGNQGETPRCASLFPEYTSEWILREIDDFETRPSDPMRVSAKDRKLVEEYLPKWKIRVSTILPNRNCLMILNMLKNAGFSPSVDGTAIRAISCRTILIS